ncbi:chemotaxis protein CheB [Paraglaciecola sp. MB-3u-78]|uniref:chemotaxis protein CheB n=1 Tax=Paraglaciecola sp. MB-3u-78 TaxID=2058332 RepID=UPI0018E3A701|nr:chemotaxis protein CheB [Paraglaciecola sp. MB-3u-78]
MKSKVEAIVIGGSAGGMNALKIILPALERHMALSVIIVLHRRWKSADDFLYRMLNGICQLSVKEADEKERLKPGLESHKSVWGNYSGRRSHDSGSKKNATSGS